MAANDEDLRRAETMSDFIVDKDDFESLHRVVQAIDLLFDEGKIDRREARRRASCACVGYLNVDLSM
jgi:hypothetical protein